MFQRFHCFPRNAKKVHYRCCVFVPVQCRPRSGPFLWTDSMKKNVFVSDVGTVVVLTSFHSQYGLHAFMSYELFLSYSSVCIVVVSVFISLWLAFTKGRILWNLYAAVHMYIRLHSALPLAECIGAYCVSSQFPTVLQQHNPLILL